LTDNRQLGPIARSRIQSAKTFVSSVSSLELTIKQMLGKSRSWTGKRSWKVMGQSSFRLRMTMRELCFGFLLFCATTHLTGLWLLTRQAEGLNC
jgi:hypothetical protein